MKTLFRIYLIHLLTLYVIAQIFVGSFTIGSTWENFAIAAGVLALLNLLLKPILKLLFFPINMITLGLFSLVINAGVFYLFLQLSPSVQLAPWTFPGVNLLGLDLPSQTFDFWGTLIIISFLQSSITNFLAHLLK